MKQPVERVYAVRKIMTFMPLSVAFGLVAHCLLLFFLTEQNRFLMIDAQSGDLTPRGQAVISHTPAGPLGTPEDLIGTLLWLVSPASAFVTGTVIPIDGGFSAYSGV